jgi:tetratricopeptide (TPR) repeat protein
MFPKVVLLILLSFPLSAVSFFGQAASGTRDEIALHSRLAQQYLQQQRPDLAIPELEKVVQFDPNNVDARGNLGVLLFFHGDYKGAIPQLRAAIAAKPNLWKVQGLLGLAEGRLQDTSASRADLEAAFPHLTDAKFQLDVGHALIDKYTATGDLDKAATVVSALLESHPTDTALLYLSYRLYSDLAGRSMLTLALSAPGSAEMHQVMARELARHDDKPAAIANYQEAIHIDPHLPGLHSELGDILYHSEDQKLQAQAGAEFEAALAENPSDEKAELSLGMIAEKNADLKTAYADESRAVEMAPNDTDAYTELAKVLVLMNQQDKAQQMLERAIQIDPTNYVAHYRLAALYRQRGKPDDAKQQVAEYLKYKQMKDKLEKIFQDMRVASGQHHGTDDTSGMQ